MRVFFCQAMFCHQRPCRGIQIEHGSIEETWIIKLDLKTSLSVASPFFLASPLLSSFPPPLPCSFTQRNRAPFWKINLETVSTPNQGQVPKEPGHHLVPAQPFSLVKRYWNDLYLLSRDHESLGNFFSHHLDWHWPPIWNWGTHV